VHLILGAGCAGLSLACALLEAGVGEQIVLVDRRTSFGHDRTWCFWAAGDDAAFGAPVTHAWPSWRFVGRDGRAVEHHAPRHPYLHVPADRFYAAALDRLGRTPNVELRLGERVLGVTDDGDCVRVHTSRGVLEGGMAFDAMGGAGPLSARRPAGSVELLQRFVGLEVEVERPRFTSQVATLMDFRTDAGRDRALRFMYVLPFSSTRALVEDTSIAGPAVPAAQRREAIGRYLEEVWSAGAVTVLREERGALPMTTHRFALTRGARIAAVGAAAGAVRPSSGYAFARLQRHVRAVARAVAVGAPLPVRLTTPRGAVLDALFLRALRADAGGFEDHLLALARGAGGGAFARFMTDASTRRDDGRVVAALARPGFLRAMATGPAGTARPDRARAPRPA